MPNTGGRNSRIAAQMQRALAQLLRRGVKDPRVGNVTVTAVELASDMSVAKIDFLPFANAARADEVLAGLRSAAGYLRGELARELKLRHAPRLDFQLDTQIEHAQHLTSLINGAVQSDRERAESDQPAGPTATDADEDA